MALNSSSVVNSTYNPIGVNYPDNLRIGTFEMGNTNSAGMGVQVGNPILITMKPAVPANLIAGQSVSNGGYLQLNAANGIGGAVVQNNRLILDYERSLIFYNPTGPFTARVSGYDRYKQKTVYTGPGVQQGGVGNFTFPTQGPIKEITSIQVFGAASSYAYTLATNYTFGMPFIDTYYPDNLPTNTNTFLNPIVNGQPALCVNASATNRRAFRAFFWYPTWGVPPTANGAVRTQLQIDPGNTPTMGVISVEMHVRNYGFSWMMNEPYNLQVNRTNNNSLRKYIGAVPYSEGWTDWKG